MQWQINIQVPKLIIFKIRARYLRLRILYVASTIFLWRTCNRSITFAETNASISPLAINIFGGCCNYVYKHRDSYNFMLRCYVTLSRVESPIATDRFHVTLHRASFMRIYRALRRLLDVIILRVYIWNSCSSYRPLAHHSTYTKCLWITALSSNDRYIEIAEKYMLRNILWVQVIE